MPRIPEVSRQDGKIYRGDTFYWEVYLYDDPEKTQPTPLTGLTPVASLTTSKGEAVADFSCAILDATTTKGQRIALTLPKALTAACTLSKYLYKLRLQDSNGELYRKLHGELETEP